MTTTDNVGGTDPLAAYRTENQTKSAAKSAVADMQERFMTLLTAQLKNQDPMNPLDNAEMTSQLAQMSTVEGIERLNSLFQKFVDAQLQSQIDTLGLQAVNLVGHGALVTGDNLTLTDEGGVAGFRLEDKADSVTVTIRDANGRAVRTMELGEQPAGVQNFVWDGMNDAGEKVENGNYRISVAAKQGDEAVKVSALQFGMVTGLTRTGEGSVLQVGGLGNFTVDEIWQVL
ncbi:MAG: flagellar hook assembly protein FlgD [Rhodocyclaceae bacterium]|nr:flagellar hook assembly protein FlgD [Rhodocyclaceae bacterium]